MLNISQMNNSFGAGLALSFPSIYKHFEPQGAGIFFFFAGLNVVSMILIFLLVPETKMRTLEDITWIFSHATGDHVKYAKDKVLPWAFERFSGNAENRCPVFTECQLADDTA